MLARVTRELPRLARAVVAGPADELAAVDAYERSHGDRSTVRSRIESLRGEEPWPGYDELTVDEVRAALGGAQDDDRADAVRSYERAHKNRAGVLSAVEREVATA